MLRQQPPVCPAGGFLLVKNCSKNHKNQPSLKGVTPHGVGRCPQGRGDRSVRGGPAKLVEGFCGIFYFCFRFHRRIPQSACGCQLPFQGSLGTNEPPLKRVTPHGVGRCPQGRGDRSVRGGPAKLVEGFFSLYSSQPISQGVTLLFFFTEKKKRSKKRKEFAYPCIMRQRITRRLH